jgi:hypothetical protein
MLRRTSLAAAALIAAALLGGCGGDGDDDDSAAADRLDVPTGHGSVAVIDDWVETLSEGDVEGAAAFFELPSVVQNGTPPITLETRAEAVSFNRSLPCGAELVAAKPLGRYVAATFRLTERPGAGECGDGVGGLARTAFLIREGKIVQWRRLPDVPSEEEPGGPVV